MRLSLSSERYDGQSAIGNLPTAVVVYDGMRTPGVLLASALLGSLVGCGGPQPTATTDPGLVGRPTGTDELVLRVENRGGLQPPLERERQLPAMSIYGDGLVLVPRPLDPNFPNPAGYELDAFRIEAKLLDDIVAAGMAVGLRGEDRHVAQAGPDFVADAWATTITLVTAAGRHVTGADALFDADDPDTAERMQLRDFVERIFGLRPADAALGRHEPEAYRVYVAAPDPGFGADPAIEAPVDWPFPDALAEWGEALPADGLSVDVRCRVLTVAELADALDVLRAATTTTVVVDGAGEQAIVAYRPLLPDEEGCGAEA
jgi:hypothetical protein